MLKKIKYKRYCKGKMKIRRTIAPDHLADCMDIGDIRKINFVSGNNYKMKLVEIKEDKINTYHSPLYDGIYEMTSDIQPLTYEQFLNLYDTNKLYHCFIILFVFIVYISLFLYIH